MKDIVILDGARTPMAEYNGQFTEISAIDLGVIAAKEALRRSGMAPEEVDHVIVGNALQTSGDAIYGARHVGLKAGVPKEVPALTVNRLCGSGIQSIINAVEQIELDEATTVLAGGMENMSQAPHVIRDDHLRPDTTMEVLAKLKPAFAKDGFVTAGNASGIVDGAAMVTVTTAENAKRKGKKPLGRVVSWGIAGCDPDIMGIGPVPATKIALKRAGLKLADIDLIEINEAFAGQILAVIKELGIDVDKLNVNGGAIALGHPLAASGTRLVLTALYELRRRQKRYGLASACIGGGQGIAMIVERVA